MHRITERLFAPEPRSTAKDIHSTVLQASQRFVICTGLEYRPAVAIGSFLAVCTCYADHVQLAGSFQDFIQQLSNDLMTDCSDSHLLSSIYQLANHASAGEGLTRTGRSLDGK